MRFGWFGKGRKVVERKAVGLSAFIRNEAGEGPARGYAGLAASGFQRNPVLYRSVRMIAEAAAMVPWLAFEGEREVAGHPLLALLSAPNPRMGGADFIEALCGHLLLSGNAYVEPVLIDGDLRELHLLRPDRVTIEAGADGWPEAFRAGSEGRSRRIPAGPTPPALLSIAASGRRVRRRRRLTSCRRPRAGTERCSTIRRVPPARWSTSRKRAAT